MSKPTAPLAQRQGNTVVARARLAEKRKDPKWVAANRKRLIEAQKHRRGSGLAAVPANDPKRLAVVEYRQGHSERLTAQKFGMSEHGVRLWAKQAAGLLPITTSEIGDRETLKTEAIAYAKAHNQREAGRKFGVSERTIRFWLGQAGHSPAHTQAIREGRRAQPLAGGIPQEVRDQAVEYAKTHSQQDTAKKFNVSTYSVSVWTRQASGELGKWYRSKWQRQWSDHAKRETDRATIASFVLLTCVRCHETIGAARNPVVAVCSSCVNAVLGGLLPAE